MVLNPPLERRQGGQAERMSNLKRYYLDDYGVLIEHPNGEYVLHSDYARLKAEVERLRASSFVTAVPVEQYERLRKAGDAMHEELGNFAMTWRLRDAWNAAKEGKPSV